MQAVQDIFGIWPSVREMAEEIGEKPNTVSKWQRRGRIPEGAWHTIIEKAAVRRRLVTTDDFVRVNRPMSPRGAASPLHPNHREAV